MGVNPRYSRGNGLAATVGAMMQGVLIFILLTVMVFGWGSIFMWVMLILNVINAVGCATGYVEFKKECAEYDKEWK